MLNKVKSYWNYGNNYYSIEITTISGGNTLHLVSAKKKKNEFTDFDFIESTSFSELAKTLPKNQHCYLIINTDKVLIKEIPFIENDQKALANAFPSLSSSDFYYEILKTKTKCFVAICRKEGIDFLLKEAASHNLEVLGFDLGFSSLSSLIRLIDENNIVSSRYEFSILDGELSSFSENRVQNSVSYTIEDFEVNSNFLPALSGIFNYLLSPVDKSSNFMEENNHLNTLQKQKNFFRKGILSGIGILLFTLLINFFVFNSYYKNLQTKQEEVQLLKSQKDRYLSKSSIIESKERIVQNILNSSTSKSSFYINRIVAYKPSSILFSEIVFQPLQRAIKADKAIEYTVSEINISGESNDKKTFSNWIETLENFDWVNNVTVTNYGYSKKNESIFSLNISILDDSEK